MTALLYVDPSQNWPVKSKVEIYYHYLMRAYLPLSHRDLELFLTDKSYVAKMLFAPTFQFIEDNNDCDEEEIEFLLSIRAAEIAQTLRSSDTAPGIVIALEIESQEIDQQLEDHIILKSALLWDQVQCALLTSDEVEELTWYATQEIPFNIKNWK